MRILLDQGAPKPIKRYLPLHVAQTAFEIGRSTLSNSELLNQAEVVDFDDAVMSIGAHLKLDI